MSPPTHPRSKPFPQLLYCPDLTYLAGGSSSVLRPLATSTGWPGIQPSTSQSPPSTGWPGTQPSTSQSPPSQSRLAPSCEFCHQNGAPPPTAFTLLLPLARRRKGAESGQEIPIERLQKVSHIFNLFANREWSKGVSPFITGVYAPGAPQRGGTFLHLIPNNVNIQQR